MMKTFLFFILLLILSCSDCFCQHTIDAEYLNDFKDGYAYVKKGELWGIIDTSGKLIVDYLFDYPPGEFSDGLAIIKSKNDAYGYINTKGEVIIETRFERAYPFHDGTAIVRFKYGEYNTDYTNGYCAIDTNGNIVERYGKVYVESDIIDGLILIKKDFLYGFMDIHGKIVVFPEFDVLRPFHSGRAYALKKSKYGDTEGYIDRAGEFVIIRDN